jgi:glycosyltransferase involved in cell wall biosynthesis
MVNAYRELASCPNVVLLSNSEAGAHDYAKWLGIPPERYRVVRNGIDPDVIRVPPPEATATLRASLAISERAPIVGSIFRFYQEKLPLHWIETAAYIARRRTDCHFVIFGEGPMQGEVRDFAKKRGFSDRLHCPGTISDSGLGLSIMDVFLLTSKFEGTPNVILEASLIGIPVVATDVGGVRETINPGTTGYVVETPDPALVAETTLAIINDPGWRTRARTEGPKFVRSRFGLNQMLEQTLKIYNQSATGD